MPERGDASGAAKKAEYLLPQNMPFYAVCVLRCRPANQSCSCLKKNPAKNEASGE
jgi:hypothetical protein